MAAASYRRRLLLLLAAAAAASAGLVAGGQSFLRSVACSPGAVSRAAVNSSSSAHSVAECALRCNGLGWCAAVLMGRSGCCDCALIDWELYYGAWLGQGANCPDGLFEKEAAVERLQLFNCEQIDITNSAPCAKAIDGGTNQVFGGGSCTHTAANSYNWWRASLQQRAFIERVALFNRLDCCSDRLNNFTISLEGSVFASYFETSVFSVKNFSCGRVGQTVQVNQYMRAALTLCEVVAYGIRFP